VASIVHERRSADRRQTHANIAFPDRRIVDRRSGNAVSTMSRHEIPASAPDAFRVVQNQVRAHRANNGHARI
jgi:hypothetical protein